MLQKLTIYLFLTASLLLPFGIAYGQVDSPSITTSTAAIDFGTAVAVSGDGQTMVVGAPLGDGTDGEGNTVNNSGIAYVHIKNELGRWQIQEELSASNPGIGDEFGYAVAISDDGNTVAVGAKEEDSPGEGVNPPDRSNSLSGSGAVYVYTRTGDAWSEQAHIKAFNPGSFDDFGTSVALSGDGLTLAVSALREDGSQNGIHNEGAFTDNNNAFSAGAVYVYEFEGSNWQSRVYVKASDSREFDLFGGSVSLNQSGDRLAVGAPLEDSNRVGVHYDDGDANTDATNSGAVYVFTRGTSTTWNSSQASQQAYIKASNTGVQDNFGYSVALSGDGNTLLAGARNERSNATDVDGNQTDDSLVSLSTTGAGAAYAFRYADEEWTQTGYLKAINTQIDQFGSSVSVSKNGLWLAAGALLEDSASTGIYSFAEGADFDVADVGNVVDTGAVYVYRYDPLNERWFYMTTVKPRETSENLNYGVAVAWGGESTQTGLAIGGDGVVEVIPINQLPATVFVDDSVVVTEGEQTTLRIALSHPNDDNFQVTLTPAADLAVVGSSVLGFSPGETSKTVTVQADNIDDVYQVQYLSHLTVSAEGYVERSFDVTILDNDSQRTIDVSSHFVHLLLGQSTELTVSLIDLNDRTSVVVTVMSGSPSINVTPTRLVFTEEEGMILPLTVTITATTAYIPSELSVVTLTADLYQPTEVEVFIEGEFERLTGSADDDFGTAAAVSGDGQTMVVGAPTGDGTDSDGSTVNNSGIAYVYVKSESGNWLLQEELSASNADSGDDFGFPVAISDDGNTVAVGAKEEDGSGTRVNPDNRDNDLINTGAVYIYTRSSAGVWSEQAYIKAFNTGMDDDFGASVALSGDGLTLAVGAPDEDGSTRGIRNHNGFTNNNSLDRAGAVYVYDFDGTDWQPRIYIKASFSRSLDRFGWSVSLNQSGSRLAVGAPFEDANRTGVGHNDDGNAGAPDSGATYMFTRGSVWSEGQSEEQAYIKASNAGTLDDFGYSVALSGDGNTLLVGARDERSNAAGVDGDQTDNSLFSNSRGAGAAYVFRYVDEEWTQTGYLKAINSEAEDRFGRSVSVSQDGLWLAVGALLEDGASTSIHSFAEGAEFDVAEVADAGAVYVYQYDPLNDRWFYMATIKPFETSNNLNYGAVVAWGGESTQTSLAIGGDGVVGVIPIDQLPRTFFADDITVAEGGQVALRIAPSYQDDDNVQVTLTPGVGLTIVGSSVLDFSPGETSKTVTVQADDIDDIYQVEYLRQLSVATEGYVEKNVEIIVLDNDQPAISVSPHFVHLLPGQSTELTVSLSSLNGNESVEVTVISSGSPNVNVTPTQLVFVEEGGEIPPLTVTITTTMRYVPSERSVVTLTADLYQPAEVEVFIEGAFNRLTGSADDDFGTAMAVSGDGQTMVVGAPAGTGTDSDGNTVNNSGIAYVYVKSELGDWLLQEELSASNADGDDAFGFSVAISDNGNIIAVGATDEGGGGEGVNPDSRGNGEDDSGAVYIYSRTGEAWDEQAYIKAFNTDIDDEFGTSVALSGDGLTLAVGAPREDGGNNGIRDEGAFTSNNDADSAGVVYMYEFDGTDWQSRIYIKASDSRAGDNFGRSVSLNQSGSRLAVGASSEDSNRVGVHYDAGDDNTGRQNSGVVYIFTRGTMWSRSQSNQQAYIKASNTGSQDNFGFSVALSGDGNTLLVGARDERSGATGVDGDQTDNSLFSNDRGAGAAYVFRYVDEEWTQTGYLKAINSEAEDRFGRSVSVSQDGLWLAVGALLEDGASTSIHSFAEGAEFDVAEVADAGAVYVYQYDPLNDRWFYMATIKPFEVSEDLNYGAVVAWGGESTQTSLAIGGDGVVEVIPIDILPGTFFVEQPDEAVLEGSEIALQVAPSYLRTQIDVTISEESDLLSIEPVVISFSTTEAQSVTVTVTDVDDERTPDRNAGFTLSAPGYIDRNYELTITDDDAQVNSVEVDRSVINLRPGETVTVDVSLSGFAGTEPVIVTAIVPPESDIVANLVQLTFSDTESQSVEISYPAVYSPYQQHTIEFVADDIIAYASAEVEVFVEGDFNQLSGSADDDFGTAVAVSGDGQTMVVGAPTGDGTDSEGNAVDDSGIAYVYIENEFGIWLLQGELSAGNADEDDEFGYAVAISDDGNVIAVGATGEDSGGERVNPSGDGNGGNNSGAVYVYIRTGEEWSQQAYIKAFNTDNGDAFGTSVALSGDGLTLAVGAPLEEEVNFGVGILETLVFHNNGTPGAGAVYVYEFSGGQWRSRVYVKASDTSLGDNFGQSVSLNQSGDRLVVGAPGENSSLNGVLYGHVSNPGSGREDSGAVYVFTRGATWSSGESSQQAYIKASNTGNQDNFGHSVALSGDGDTLLVGARDERSNATGVNGDQTDDSLFSNGIGAGAAYVFRYADEVWTQAGYLKAINPGAEDRFSRSVSVSKDGAWLAAGALLEDSENTGIHNFAEDDSFDIGDVSDVGAVYVYRSNPLNGQWFYMTTIKPYEVSEDLNYGLTVAWGGESTQTSLAIGGDGVVELIPAGTLPRTFFVGDDPIMEGDTQAILRIALSYPGEDNVQAMLTPGDGLAIVGSSVLEFAPGETSKVVTVSVTDFDNTYEREYLSQLTVSAEGYVERSFAITILDNDVQQTINVAPDFVRLLPGQSTEITVGLDDLNGNESVEVTVASDASNIDVMPTRLVFTEAGGIISSLTVTLDADVGFTPHQQSVVTFTADLYQPSEVLVSLVGEFERLPGSANNNFGGAVAVSGDGQTMVVGAPLGEGNTVNNSGIAYVYAKNEFSEWLLQGELSASNADGGDEFGRAVTISDDGNTVAVGARGEDSSGEGVNPSGDGNGGNNSGAVYVYTRTGDEWGQQAYIKAFNTGTDDAFGTSVALSGDGLTLAVGAPEEDAGNNGIQDEDTFTSNNNVAQAGAVYVYEFDGTQWQSRVYVKASDSEGSDQFGWSVSLNQSGSRLAVGAYSENSERVGVHYDDGDDNTGATDSGAVYMFTRGTSWSSDQSNQQAYIKASNTGQQDNFGYSVALSGDGNTLLAGARDERSNATGVDGDQTNNSLFSNARGAGAAYAFRYADEEWTQTGYLKAINSGAEDRFGRSASVSKDGLWLAVGAFFEDSASIGIYSFAEGDNFDTGNASNTGAAYVYQYDSVNQKWFYTATIKPFETSGGLNYGSALAWGGESTQTSLAIGGDGVVEVIPIDLLPRTFFVESVPDLITEGDSFELAVAPSIVADAPLEVSVVTVGLVTANLEFTSSNLWTLSIDIENDGIILGDSLASVTLEAEGYESKLLNLMVNDIGNEFIVQPSSLTLTEGQEGELEIALLAITDPALVTVSTTEDLILGDAGMSAMLTFTNTDPQTLKVTAQDDSSYVGNRSVVITLGAERYDTREVEVMIEDDDDYFVLAPTGSLQFFEGDTATLQVSPFALFRGEQVEVTVSIDDDLTVNDSSSVMLTFSDPIVPQEVMIETAVDDGIFTGRRSGIITIMAEHYRTAQVQVTAIDDELGFDVSESTLVLVEGDSTVITVGPSGVIPMGGLIVDVVPSDDLRVTPSNYNFTDNSVQELTITADNDNIYNEAVRTVTIRPRSAVSGYSEADIDVMVIDNDVLTIRLLSGSALSLIYNEEREVAMVVDNADTAAPAVTVTAQSNPPGTLSFTNGTMVSGAVGEELTLAIRAGGVEVEQATLILTAVADSGDYREDTLEIPVSVGQAEIIFRVKVFLEGAQ